MRNAIVRNHLNSLWSHSKKLALNSKKRIIRISDPISWKFSFHSIFIPEFPELSVNGSLLGISTISRFSGNFLRKFPYHDVGDLGGMESAQGQPCKVIQIFGNFLPGIIGMKLNFLLSGILVWMVRFADFVFLRDFLDNVHRKFRYLGPHF